MMSRRSNEEENKACHLKISRSYESVGDCVRRCDILSVCFKRAHRLITSVDRRMVSNRNHSTEPSLLLVT